MNPADAAKEGVDAELASPRFRAGVARGYWKVVFYQFPTLMMAVSAVEPDGKAGSYDFRFELSGFPGTAPDVRIWDCVSDTLLAAGRRPKGSGRVVEAFKDWGDKTVYRPWDRIAGPHNNWPRNFPGLAWHPHRDLAFILEDLHGLLISNALAGAARARA